MAWFRWLYEHILIWLAWAHDLVDPIRDRIRRVMHLLKRSGLGGHCACSGACAPRARGATAPA